MSKENQRALTNELEQSKENHAKVLQKKDAEQEELNNIKEQQSHQLAEMQLSVKSLQSSLTAETQRYVKNTTSVQALTAMLWKSCNFNYSVAQIA